MARALVAAVIAAVAIGGGYYWFAKRQSSAAALSSAPPPPPEVGVSEVQLAEVPLSTVYAGRVVGFRNVEVRPQIGGILLKREFAEGARVEKDQVLFRIDPRPYQIALERANAQLAQAEASLRQTEDNFRRVEDLARRQVSTEKQLEEARAARDQSRAAVKLAQVEIDSATLNLTYTVIAAPVAGTTSLQSPAEGALIQPQQTVLTTITPLDPSYVSFSATDDEARQFRAMNQARKTPIKAEDLTVQLSFGDGAVYPHPGRVDMSARTVDPRTGTIQIRAIFPNPEGALLPGQFVRLRVSGFTLQNTILVPKRAVSQGPQGPFVYVVDDRGTARSRSIRLNQEIGESWVVQDGLKAGERLVVDGVIRVRPGMPVKAVSAETPVRKQASGNPAAGATP